MYTVGDEEGSTAKVRINAHFMAQVCIKVFIWGKAPKSTNYLQFTTYLSFTRS